MAVGGSVCVKNPCGEESQKRKRITILPRGVTTPFRAKEAGIHLLHRRTRLRSFLVAGHNGLLFTVSARLRQVRKTAPVELYEGISPCFLLISDRPIPCTAKLRIKFLMQSALFSKENFPVTVTLNFPPSLAGGTATNIYEKTSAPQRHTMKSYVRYC